MKSTGKTFGGFLMGVIFSFLMGGAARTYLDPQRARAQSTNQEQTSERRREAAAAAQVEATKDVAKAIRELAKVRCK